MSANFSYHFDGQIAGVTYADGAVRRPAVEAGTLREPVPQTPGGLPVPYDGTELLNEPAVTGGNPVLSGDKVLFNDMLGNTLGVKGKDAYQPIKMTAFGESDNVDAFFTGKPLVGELGYAFLFRNYRPEQGKWQTADPLGYPDGWNNFAYVNNAVIQYIDWAGTAAHAISKMDEISIAQGSARFSVKITAYCNDNYNSPALTDIAVHKSGTTNVTVGLDFTLGGVAFGLSATINFDSISSSVKEVRVVDNKDGTKTVTADIYVTYTVTAREVLAVGAIEKSETGNKMMSISCTVKE